MEILDKIEEGNRRFIRGERTGLCNPVDVGMAAMGSLENAVDHLKVPLILVLGHENCGAVKAVL